MQSAKFINPEQIRFYFSVSSVSSVVNYVFSRVHPWFNFVFFVSSMVKILVRVYLCRLVFEAISVVKSYSYVSSARPSPLI
jgi:hypothetical protein